ncbi:hypothetical protein DL96DRAFT_1716385 [Flagelloscypha sp. PMI_526]|nr:hypothetical protein DL96DRAFT_1716385 [Flagelloscypha sp. PMI_526]
MSTARNESNANVGKLKEELEEDCPGTVCLDSCAPQLPSELVDDILGLVAMNAHPDQRIELLTLSKSIYYSLFRLVYGAIYLPPMGSTATATSPKYFASLSAWVDSKPRELQQKITAFRLHLEKAGEDEEPMWTCLLNNLSGLEIFDVYCYNWTKECTALVWKLIFQLPTLKNVRFDWHFDIFCPPARPKDTLLKDTHFPLRTITHLSIVPPLSQYFLRRFIALTHLALFNPIVGCNRDDIFALDAALPNLRMLVLIIEDNEFEDWRFDSIEKIVVIAEMERRIFTTT